MPASMQTAPCRGSPHRLGEGDVGRGWQDIKYEVGAETKGAGERGTWEGPSCTALRTWCPGRGLIRLCAPLPLSKPREEIISRERMASHKVKMIVPLTRVFLRTQRRGGHCPPKQFLGGDGGKAKGTGGLEGRGYEESSEGGPRHQRGMCSDRGLCFPAGHLHRGRVAH